MLGPEIDLMLGFVVISTIVSNCCDAIYKEKTYSEFNIKHMLNYKLKCKTLFLNKKGMSWMLFMQEIMLVLITSEYSNLMFDWK